MVRMIFLENCFVYKDAASSQHLLNSMEKKNSCNNICHLTIQKKTREMHRIPFSIKPHLNRLPPNVIHERLNFSSEIYKCICERKALRNCPKLIQFAGFVCRLHQLNGNPNINIIKWKNGKSSLFNALSSLWQIQIYIYFRRKLCLTASFNRRQLFAKLSYFSGSLSQCIGNIHGTLVHHCTPNAVLACWRAYVCVCVFNLSCWNCRAFGRVLYSY